MPYLPYPSLPCTRRKDYLQGHEEEGVPVNRVRGIPALPTPPFPTLAYLTCTRRKDYLQGHEEEGIPEDRVRVPLPHDHILWEPLCQELVTVIEVETHSDQDWKQGEQLKCDIRRFLDECIFSLPEFRWGTAGWPWGLWSLWQKDQRRWRGWTEATSTPRKEAEMRKVGLPPIT